MKRFLAPAALALILTACTNDNEVTDNGPVAAVINAEISNAVTTRASGTTWAMGDQIGISTEEGTGTYFNNVCYEWNGSSFTTPVENAIYFQSPEVVTFYAYCPFTGIPGTAAGVLTGVSTGKENQTAENRPLIDFLYASGAIASTHNPTVNFTDGNPSGTANPDPALDHSFHHCMSQISLTFEAGEGISFSAVKPESYTLSELALEGSFDTATGIAKADEDAQTADLTMDLGGTLTSSVILFPQEVQSIGLTVKFDGNGYNATLEIPEDALKAGNNYTWTVRVSVKGLMLENCTIGAWTDGNSGSGSVVLP